MDCAILHAESSTQFQSFSSVFGGRLVGWAVLCFALGSCRFLWPVVASGVHVANAYKTKSGISCHHRRRRGVAHVSQSVVLIGDFLMATVTHDKHTQKYI